MSPTAVASRSIPPFPAPYLGIPAWEVRPASMSFGGRADPVELPRESWYQSGAVTTRERHDQGSFMVLVLVATRRRLFFTDRPSTNRAKKACKGVRGG